MALWTSFDWLAKPFVPDWLKPPHATGNKKTIAFDEQVVFNQRALGTMRANFSEQEIEQMELLVTARTLLNGSNSETSGRGISDKKVTKDSTYVRFDSYALYQNMDDCLKLQTDVIHALALQLESRGALAKSFDKNAFDTTRFEISAYEDLLLEKHQAQIQFGSIHILAANGISTLLEATRDRRNQSCWKEITFDPKAPLVV